MVQVNEAPAYYNEIDPFAASWLRELIRAGHLPAGDVDERSIADVSPADLRGYRQCHFFAGIGGWALALRFAGWPDDRLVWTGSCPCQPFSVAGKQRGAADERHLWPEFARLIGECRPATVFGEQVASPAGRTWFAGVRADLEALGYAAGGGDLCAAGVRAPHIRQRLYWVADTGCGGNERWMRPREAHGAAAAVEREAQQRQQCGADPGCSGGTDWMVYANGDRREARRTPCAPARYGGSADAASCIDGLDHAERAGLERHAGNGDNRNEPGRIDANEARSIAATGGAGPWDKYGIAWLRDGTARRIEPGTFPLAHGIPGRVGCLRGYGNAIVPQIAAEFIGAYLEARAA